VIKIIQESLITFRRNTDHDHPGIAITIVREVGPGDYILQDGVPDCGGHEFDGIAAAAQACSRRICSNSSTLALLFNRVSSRAREPETRSTVYGFLLGGGPNEMIVSEPNQSIEINS
jgi:hypothetical protein